jgi:CTP synthase
MLHENGLDTVVCRELHLDTIEPDLSQWNQMLSRIKARTEVINIAIVGKYVKLHDAYLSVAEALRHAGYEVGAKININWVDSEEISSENVASLLGNCAGILVPGGFGDRGIEGKITACKYARENNVPYFGICLGMQIAVIEFARNVCGLQTADSREFSSNGDTLVIDLMPDQVGRIQKGGTMRLGSYPCKIKSNTILKTAYSEETINERHRHRYEFNNDYRQVMESAGLTSQWYFPR